MQFRSKMKANLWRTLGRRAMMAGVLSAAALTSPATPARAQNPTIGVVDGVKINDGFTKLKTAMTDIDKRKDQLRTQLDARAFMGETEAKRFDELIVKNNRSDAENQEVERLVKAGNDRRTEYNTLIGKEQKSDADKTRIKTLEDDATKTGQSFEVVVKTLDGAISKQELDTEDQFRTQIIKAVEQVATEKKLVLVVGKQAIAWNSQTIEITEEVLSRLNKS
jgi:Skp family chaperone for outer membrane proteins